LVVVRVANRLISNGHILREDDRRQELVSRVLIYPRAKDRKGFGLVIIPFKLANQ
jgi:hypothetical protein